MKKLPEYIGDFEETQTRFRIIGDISKLPQVTQDAMHRIIEDTKGYTGMTLTLALNYGSRDEITRAMKQIITENIPSEAITEETIQSHLDTHDMPDVDLVIRTGGAQRLSNYLLWQCAYAEIYVTPTYWPAFSQHELLNILHWYNEQKRNFGVNRQNGWLEIGIYGIV